MDIHNNLPGCQSISCFLLYFVSVYQMTYLHVAVEGGHMNTVKHLVDKGADINTKDDHGVSVNASNTFSCDARSYKNFLEDAYRFCMLFPNS